MSARRSDGPEPPMALGILTADELVDRIKQIPKRATKAEITPHAMEIALAWARQEVTSRQVAKVLGFTSQSATVYFCANALAAAIRSGRLALSSDVEERAIATMSVELAGAAVSKVVIERVASKIRTS